MVLRSSLESGIRLLLVMLVVIAVIGIYGHMRCKYKFVDPLSRKLGIGDLDGWSITHLVLFSAVGYQASGLRLGLLAFVFGVIWETIEHVLGRSRPSWLGGWGGCNAAEFEKHNANWWFGRWSDISINTAGILAGNFVRWTFGQRGIVRGA